MLASPAAFAGGAGNGDPSAGSSGGSTAGNSANNNSGAPAASTQPASAPVNPSPSSAELQSEIDAMRALVQSQADQIQKQQEELAEMKAKLAGNNSNSPAQPAPSSSISTAPPVAGVPAIAAQPSVPAATSTPASTIEPASLSTPGSPAGDEHSPLFFKIGDAKFTPGGFMDATAVIRTTGTGNGIGTSFGGIPYNNSLPAAGLTETRFSVQNSRISMRVDAPVGSGTITGYYEADFLGLTAANANVTSNANTLRSRLYFADYSRGHWEFLAGQTWSMLTPGRNGISPWPSDIFYSQDMDTNYQVGLTWARQLGFRVVYHPSKVWALGLSVENPDQLIGSAATCPSALCGASYNAPPTGELDTASGSTLSTPPTANYMPDFILKIAVDPMLGERHFHFDFAGLLSDFKLVTPGSVLSTTAGTPRQTETATGGGFEVGANMELFKNFRLIGQGYWSDGGGRYIYGLGPDLVVRQATTTSPFVPSPVKAESSILGFEWQAMPKSLLYAYYGGTEFGRDYSYQPVATGTPATFVGYGYPTAPSSQNRAIQEGTFGWIQDFFKSPNFGKFSLITQASYLTRDPWTAGANPRDAHLVEIYMDIRYTLP
jgi:hypothetical protein